MDFIERQFLLLSWIMKARQARVLQKDSLLHFPKPVKTV